MLHPGANFLNETEALTLIAEHRMQKEKRLADRIKSIILLNKGYGFSQISEILLMDDSTIREYYQVYQKLGLKGLITLYYQGGLSYLSNKEIRKLDAHLQSHTYLTAKEIVKYIHQTFQVKYTSEGIRALLHRLDYVYKKPKHLPGKADAERQETFIKDYTKIKQTKAKEDEIYFMDGCHPQHNSITANGWIKKGEEKYLKANCGRQRININGACNAAKGEVVIRTDEAINAQSTIALMGQLQVHQPIGKIIIIADNARYYRSQLVQAYLQDNKRIELHFLPPYSPNLNLIERLWKFYKKETLYNQYYEDFKTFKKETLLFFKNIYEKKDKLLTLLADNFHTHPINCSEIYVG